MLVEGVPCRYGHPWNRSADWARCLSCYPLAPPRPAPSEEELKRRAESQRERAKARRAERRGSREDWLKEVSRKEQRAEAARAKAELTATRRAAEQAAAALRRAKAEATVAERKAQQEANDRRRAETLAVRRAATERHAARLAQREAERLDRERRTAERLAAIAEKRRSLTHAELKDRARRAAKKKGDWFRLVRRTLMRADGPRASTAELKELLERQSGRCGLTGMLIPSGVRPHLDHKVPVSKGGNSAIDNLHWTHPMANWAKNDSTVDEFRAWLLEAAAALPRRLQLEALL